MRKKLSSFRLKSLSFKSISPSFRSKSTSSLQEKRPTSNFTEPEEDIESSSSSSSTPEDPNGIEDEYEEKGDITEGGRGFRRIGNKADTCLICEERYKVGEKIYWSRNPKCNHSFHSTCMMHWLFDNDDCPVCQQFFLVPKTIGNITNSQSKVQKIEVDGTFNIDVGNSKGLELAELSFSRGPESDSCDFSISTGESLVSLSDLDTAPKEELDITRGAQLSDVTEQESYKENNEKNTKTQAKITSYFDKKGKK